jgi:hypothetical protein
VNLVLNPSVKDVYFAVQWDETYFQEGMDRMRVVVSKFTSTNGDYSADDMVSISNTKIAIWHPLHLELQSPQFRQKTMRLILIPFLDPRG